MNNTGAIIEEIAKKAKKSPELREQFLALAGEENQYQTFCQIAASMGYELYPMDLIDYEDAYVMQLQKSVNGGGAQHDLLLGQDQFLKQFLAEIAF